MNQILTNKASKDNLKVKYLLGIYKDLPGYPTLEDFYYIVHNWYFNEKGNHFIHEYQKIPFTSNVIFSNKMIEEKIGNLEKTNELIDKLIKDKIILIHKETKFTTYYSIIDETKTEFTS